MKALTIIKSIAAFSAILYTLTGCTEPETVATTTFSLEKDKVEANALGGEYFIGYTVDNPKSSETIPLASTDVEWINEFSYDDSHISFNIDSNTEKESRQATVTVTYEGFNDKCTFTVNQSAGGDFILSTKNISVPAEGGEYNVQYSLSGDVQDASVSASCAESWISSIDCSTKGEISFSVASNGSLKERKAFIKVKCSKGNLEETISVTQSGNNESFDAPFEITIDEISPAEVIYSIIPKDPEMTYLSMVISKESFDKYNNEDDFLASEMEFYEMMAQASGLTLEEYLEQNLMQGEQKSISGTFLDPETAYYAYAYGVNSKGEKLSDIAKEEFTTAKLERKDMTFRFEYTAEISRVDVATFPSLLEDWYFFSAMRAEGLGENPDMEYIIEDYLSYVIEYYMMTQGGTIEEALQLVAYRGVGLNSFDLVNDMEYILFAAAIDMSTGLVVSDVTEERFMSPKAESDNEITLQISHLGFTKADIEISVTNNDPYVFCIDLAQNWEGMSEVEMLAKLTEKDMSYFVRNGNFLAPVENREPGVEYRAFAFGYSSGIATTPLTTLTFKPHDIAESDIELTVNYDKYYDIDALKEMYPGQFDEIPSAYKIIMPVWTSVKGSDVSDVKYYYSVYEGDWTNSSDVYTMAETLLSEGCPDPEANFYLLRDGYKNTHTIIGIAADSNGKFGPLFRTAINITDEGISPAEDYPIGNSANSAAAKHRNNIGSSQQNFDYKDIPVRKADVRKDTFADLESYLSHKSDYARK